ncbi:unnamed protein product [Brassica oleracea var. botrytis]
MISRRCIRGDKGSRGDVSTLPTLVVLLRATLEGGSNVT